MKESMSCPALAETSIVDFVLLEERHAVCIGKPDREGLRFIGLGG